MTIQLFNIITKYITDFMVCILYVFNAPRYIGPEGAKITIIRSVWDMDAGWPKEACIWCGAHWRHLANTTEPSSAVTIFSNDIKIATLDQNRKKIESSILPSQGYDFHES